jgi:hypothetical protein
MSLGYADRLSFREDLGGQLGAPELQDSPEEVEAKVARLAELVGAVASDVPPAAAALPPVQARCHQLYRHNQCGSIAVNIRSWFPHSMLLLSLPPAACKSGTAAVGKLRATACCCCHNRCRCRFSRLGASWLSRAPASAQPVAYRISGGPTASGPCSERGSPCRAPRSPSLSQSPA